MAQVVKLKRSSTAGNVPTSGQMVAGELAMNTGDGKLYLRDDSDVRPIVTVDNEVTGSVILIGNISASGDISSSGYIWGTPIVGANEYAFRYQASNGVIQNTGLFFNATTGQYEFLNSTSTCIFCIKAGSGNTTIEGNVTASSDVDIQGVLSIPGFSNVSASLAAAGGGGSGTVTEVTVGTGLDVTNGTTTPNVTLDLTEITLSNGLDSTATGLTLDLTEVIATDGANRVLTSDGDGTLTGEANLTFNGTTLNIEDNVVVGDGTATSLQEFYPAGSSYMSGLITYGNDLSSKFTSDGESQGEYLRIPTATTLTQYDIVYLRSNTGGWSPANATIENTAKNLMAIVTKGGTNDYAMTRGYIRVPASRIEDADLATPSPAYGDPLYLSTGSNGYFMGTAPSGVTGDIVRKMGYVVNYTTDRSGNVTSWLVKFDPSNDYIEN